MNNNKEEFCRLCADLKLCTDLINISIEVEICDNIKKMLKRFDITLNLVKHLPKTVCLGCINSLERAYEFVSSVDLAQKAYEEYVASDLDIDESDVYLDIDHSAEDTTENNTLTDSEISEEDIFKKDDDFNEGRQPNKVSKTDEKTKKVDVYRKDIVVKNDKEFNIDEKSTKNYKVSKTLEDSKKDIELQEFEKPLMRNIIENKKTETQIIDTSETEIVELKKGRKKSLIMLTSSESTVAWSTYKWVCAYCDNYYSNPSELRVHSMQYHNVCNPFRCFDCRARGSQIEKFVAHVCKHRPNLSLLCYICSSEFETAGDLKEHKLKVHIATNFTHICGATFQTKEELQNHINNFYKNVTIRMLPYKNNETLICVICKKILKTRVLLNRHLLIHTERQRSYICKICKKRFYTKRELNQHVVVHSDKRPFKCEICDYSFKIKSELKKHVQKHFEVKRFTCDKCGKNFRQRKELIVHSAIHQDSRSFICAYCNKAFRFKHLLLQHIRVHTGEKPYCCDLCPQRFRNWPNYNRHSKDMHGINRARKKTNFSISKGDPDQVMKWKNDILEPKKKGRPKKLDDSNKK